MQSNEERGAIWAFLLFLSTGIQRSGDGPLFPRNYRLNGCTLARHLPIRGRARDNRKRKISVCGLDANDFDGARRTADNSFGLLPGRNCKETKVFARTNRFYRERPINCLRLVHFGIACSLMERPL
jgi:hypothetical protein